MKSCATTFLVVALSALSACALGAAAPATPDPGFYQARISGVKPAALNGTWRIRFGGGSYRITRNGVEAIGGFTSIRGNRITFDDWFGPFRCKGVLAKGTYRWSLTGKTLTFRVVSDRCPGRKTVLLRAFTKLS